MSRYGRLAYETLKEHSLAPKKKFGQNFLIRPETAEAIVQAGEVSPADTIIEVGVGLGALTIPLASSVDKVLGFEIDSGIVRFHEMEKDLPQNVTLIHQDILKADLSQIAEQCGGRLKIIANLPYSISNPFIFKLIDNSQLIQSATVMLQKEVADRLNAHVNTKQYGVPTILLASCARVTRKLTLKPQEFYPRPKIDSEVITIHFQDILERYSQGNYDYALLKKIVRTTFNQRRKTLLNTLSHQDIFGSVANQNKAQCRSLAATALESIGLSPSARPETLTPHQFVELTKKVEKILS